MNAHGRRYIFIDYENLKQVKFKKLEKVCDRVFILINAEEQFIPFSLVQQMQRLGRGIKWIPIYGPNATDFNYHISFLMGKLHQKVSKDIEFAILSNDSEFDSLINFINAEGRSCLRVKRKRSRKEKQIPEQLISETENGAVITAEVSDFSHRQFLSDAVIDESLVHETAKETIERLMRSGNRPAEINMLKSYILLHNQELTEHGNVDKIIQHLQEAEEIEINEGEVIYNF
ncbi:MAG: PIN domain-containing protein [Bacteroidota bacterium]